MFGDLRPLAAVFGGLAADREQGLREQLLAIDDALHRLAVDASQHVGVGFTHSGLGVFEQVREVSGGPSGTVGDIWFELRREDESWEITAAIPVHCDLMPLGYSCTHDLYEEARTATSPETAVQALGELVADVRTRLPGIPKERFDRYPHSRFREE